MKTLYFSREDRLSELPDSVIDEILSLTPTRDVVKTSILSKRWKGLWTSIHGLNFQVEDPVFRSRKFVHQALLHWKGTSIRTFKISFITFLFLDALVADLDSWVRFATEKKVENLTLEFPFDWGKEPKYSLPLCIYSCSSIKKLCISGCQLEIIQDKDKVEWDELETLNLEGGNLSEDVINRVVSSAPRLQKLDLRLRASSHNLKIESNSLKRLSVTKYYAYAPSRYDPSRYRMLTICAPKLESLHLWGNAYSQCNINLLNSSLTHATLCFYEKWCPKLEQTLLQILPSIQHVEALTLSPCAFKMLGVIQDKWPYQLFENVKKLKLDGGPITSKEMGGLAQMFSEVETLVIDWKHDRWYPHFRRNLSLTKYKESEAKPPFLKHLRTVEIIPYSNHHDRSAFQPIFRFLRDHASATMLQKTAVIRNGDEGWKLDELKAKLKSVDWNLLFIYASTAVSSFLFHAINTM